MPVQSPIHSFVDFENRISTVLPAYKSQLSFQFLFSSDMEVPMDGTVQTYIGKADKTATVFPWTPAIYDVCFWGKIVNIDADADFPIMVHSGQIIPANTYETFDELLAAFQAVGFNATAQTFLQCCVENLQNYTIDFTTGYTTSKTLNINFFRGLVYIDGSNNDQEADFNTNNIAPSQCYTIAVKHSASDTFYYSNVFFRVASTKQLTFFTYSNNEDSYDFHYPADYLVNRLWFPFYFSKPAYPVSRKIYRKSNKDYRVLSSTIEKQLTGLTDYFKNEIHDRLIVALEHDHKHVLSNDVNYAIDQDIFMNSDYQINWPDRDYPDAPVEANATFKVLQVFAGRNSNCEKRPVCVALPEPIGCVPVTIDTDTGDLPNAVVGAPYNAHIILSGTAPFDLIVNDKPSWMTITIPNPMVPLAVISGTPDVAADDVTIDVTFTNCDDGSVNFNTTIDVLAEAGGGTHWGPTTFLDDGDPEFDDYEQIKIFGAAGETVTVTVTGYTNNNGGTAHFKGFLITEVGQTFNITLNGSGESSLISAYINGAHPHHYSSTIQVKLTITAATGGSIGSPANYLFGKVF